MSSPSPFSPQSTGHVIHVVHESVQVAAVHHMHPVQMDHHQAVVVHPTDTHDRSLLLRHAGIHGQEDNGSLETEREMGRHCSRH